MASITIKPPIEKIQAWIKDIAKKSDLRRILTRATLELSDLARKYPTAGPWNREPGTRGNGVWYERGVGTRYTKKGASRGGVPHFSGYGGRNASQKLQKNWHTEIQRKDDYTAEVYTNVTYAPYLFDPAKRVNWAAKHGWKTVDEIADDYAPRFTELVLEAIDEHISKL